MARIAYVNGAYVRHAHAQVHVEDRGLQFGDAVYEVWAVQRGRLVDSPRHFDRLERSLGELSITAPMSRAALERILREVLRRNRISDGVLYLQITRGVAPRDHGFPQTPPHPVVIVTARAFDTMAARERARLGVGVVTHPETRWARCDIKSTNLLPNVLAKQAARSAGAHEAWFVDNDGLVTEGASTNAWIVTGENEIITRSLDANILSGVTRLAVIKIAEERQMAVRERAFSVDEAMGAREAFITSAMSLVTPVVSIDGTTIGDGVPGPTANALRDAYLAEYAAG